MSMAPVRYVFLTLLLNILTAQRAIPQVTLTSNPPLHGQEICPDSGVITLHCTASVPDEVAKWFRCSNTNSSCKMNYISESLKENYDFLPVEIEADIPIPGVTVTLDMVSIRRVTGGHSNFTSTLTVNLTQYRQQEMLAFSCGTAADRFKSNPVSLNFTLRAPVPPIPLQLVATYDSFTYELRRIKPIWSQNNTLPATDECSDVLLYEIFLTSNSGNEESITTLRVDECNTPICSTELNIYSDMATSYTVSMLSRDKFGYYSEETVVHFDDRIGSTVIMDSFNHSFSFGVCEVLFNFTAELETEQLTIQYTPQGSPLQSSEIVSVVANQYTLLHIKPNTLYYYVMTLDINTTLRIEIEGTIITTLAPSRLTAQNLGLLITGVLIFIATVLLFIVLVFPVLRKLHTQHQVSDAILKVWSVLGVTLMTLSLLLWIAVGFQTGLKDDTCEVKWQQIRDALITASFVITMLALLLVLTEAISICIIHHKDNLATKLKKPKAKMSPITSEDQSSHSSQEENSDAFYMKQNQGYVLEYFGEETANDTTLYDLPEVDSEPIADNPYSSNFEGAKGDDDEVDRGEKGSNIGTQDDRGSRTEDSTAHSTHAETLELHSGYTKENKGDSREQIDGTHSQEITTQGVQSLQGEGPRKPPRASRMPLKSSAGIRMRMQAAPTSQLPHRYDELEMTSDWLYHSQRVTKFQTSLTVDEQAKNTISQIYDEPDQNNPGNARPKQPPPVTSTHVHNPPDVVHHYDKPDRVNARAKQLPAAASTHVHNPPDVVHHYDKPDRVNTRAKQLPAATATQNTQDMADVAHLYDEPDVKNPTIIGNTTKVRPQAKTAAQPDSGGAEEGKEQIAMSELTGPTQEALDKEETGVIEVRKQPSIKSKDGDSPHNRNEPQGKEGDVQYTYVNKKKPVEQPVHFYVNQEQEKPATVEQPVHFYVNQEQERTDEGPKYHYIESSRLKTHESEAGKKQWPYGITE